MRRQQASFQDVIPDYRFPPVFCKIVADPQNQIPLQIIFAFQAAFPYPFLAVRTSAPMQLQGLIPSDMHHRKWKKIHHLIQHIFKEPDRLFLACAYQMWKNASGYFHLVFPGLCFMILSACA